MTFRILGLDPAPWSAFSGLPEATLAAHGLIRMRVDQPHSAPCRISLEDAAPGETVLLANFEHQPATTPFKARGPIFVRETAVAAFDQPGTVPDAIRRRPISARAYDEAGMMLDGEVVDGAAVGDLLETWLARPAVAEVHLHYARRGCFAARAVRA